MLIRNFRLQINLHQMSAPDKRMINTIKKFTFLQRVAAS